MGGKLTTPYPPVESQSRESFYYRRQAGLLLAKAERRSSEYGRSFGITHNQNLQLTSLPRQGLF
jgi:hypothetical protein